MTEVERRKIDQEDLIRMAVPPDLWEATLDRVPEGVRPVVERYLRRVPKMVSICAGLLIHGPAGVGKSAIAALIAKEVRACRMPVHWVSVSDLRECVRKRVMFDEDQTFMDRVRGVSLLVLDDLHAEDATERVFGALDLERLVLHRGGWRRPTILTTRLGVAEVSKGFGTFLKATQGHMVAFPVDGPSQRSSRQERLQGEVFDVS